MLWYQNILDVRDIGYKYHELLIHNVHSILGKLKFYNLTWTNLSDINKWRTLAVLYIHIYIHGSKMRCRILVFASN